MDKPIYAREHDLLKLCDEFRNKPDEDGKIIRIHYCPEELARIDARLYEQLKKSPLWPSLRHHCNLGFHQSHNAHGCADYKNRDYGVTIDDLFLTLADTRASAISRKLRIGVKNQGGFFYRTIRIWKEGREGQPTDKLFGPYKLRSGPVLPDMIGPEGIENEEARYAMLCELCQRAQAVKSFRKFLDDKAMVVEHLCEGCFEIRALDSCALNSNSPLLGQIARCP